MLFIFLNLFFLKEAITNKILLIGFVFMFLLALISFILIKLLKITTFSFSLLLLAIFLHNLGSLFGYYYTSPVFLPWDYVTHIVAMAALTMIFFNYFNFKKFNSKNIILLVLILLAVNGMGALVEINEYLSYIFFGLKDGAFLFGGADYEKIIITNEVITEIEMHGGGWYDSMDDLLVNLYTSIVTLILCILKSKFFSRK